jgi:hypothetical protein
MQLIIGVLIMIFFKQTLTDLCVELIPIRNFPKLYFIEGMPFDKSTL